ILLLISEIVLKISFASSNLDFTVKSAFTSDISCLVNSFVSVLLLQLIKKKKASALAVFIIDFVIVVFLVTISLLQK
ncbi:hypothetical protein E3A20_13310, partial [Planctomyces bekefii]